jgi:Spy/CpxP family protein refolding chaperone
MKRFAGILALALTAVLLMGAALAAQRTGWQSTPEKIYWPEKEEVRVIGAGHLILQDPCVTRSLFDLRGARPGAC